MKYVHEVLAIMVVVACFGAGCTSLKSNTPAVPNVSTTPVASSGTSTWVLYEDDHVPLRFFYPTSATMTSYEDEGYRIRFDFFTEPTRSYVGRKMDILHRMSDKTDTEGLPCLKKTSWPSRLLIGGKAFSMCVTEGAAAGSRYRSYVFTPASKAGTRFIFSVRYVNDVRVIGGCESGTSTQSACRPFNEETDTKIFRDVISTIRFESSN